MTYSNADETPRFHVNNDGIPGTCSATTRSCPYGWSMDEHPATIEEAISKHEAQLEASHGGDTSLQKDATIADGENQVKEYSPQEYHFSKLKLDAAIAKIDKANRKAEKAGIAERIEYSTQEYHLEEYDENGMSISKPYVKFTVETPVVKHDGWTFAGTMTWDEEAGLVTRMAPNQELISHPEAKLCDVCKTVRHRNDTYIVQKDSEQKQVGSNCLKQFMGIKPAGLWMLEYDFAPPEGPDSNYVNGRAGRWDEFRVDATEMMGLALAISEEHGWVSKSAAYEYGKTSTVERLFRLTEKSTKPDIHDRGLYTRGQELHGEAAKVIEYAKNIDGDSEYARNMRSIASAETVANRNISTLVSAIGGYQREQAKKIETANNPEKKESYWVGEVEQKFSEPKVTVTNVVPVTNYYNGVETHASMIIMQDEEGNVYKTQYGGSKEYRKGQSFELVNSKIKKHTMFNGVKQTELTRISTKVIRPETQPATELDASSPFVDAWTTDEADALMNKRHKDITKEFQKKHGMDKWDKDRKQFTDPEINNEYRAETAKSSREGELRWRELSSFESQPSE